MFLPVALLPTSFRSIRYLIKPSALIFFKTKTKKSTLIPLLVFLSICGFKLLPAPFQTVSQTNLPLTGLATNSMDVESGDIDGDGDQDLVVAMEFRPNVLLLNDGAGVFVNASSGRLPRKNHDSEDIALADFDRDGDLDIIFVSEDDHINEYYLNDGKGFFSDVSETFPIRATSNAVVAADFDGDGDLDLVVGNAGQDNLLLNDGKGAFKEETSGRMPTDTSVTQDVEGVDIDGDKDLDLIFGNEDGNRVYINNGKGYFKDATASCFPSPSQSGETRKVDVGDVDGDGDQDLFFSNVAFIAGKNPANRLFINNGRGTFKDDTEKRFIARNDLNSADACFFDLDGDRDLDLIIANIFGGYQQLLINNGSGVFTEDRTGLLPASIPGEAISVEVFDANRDGKGDLYFGMFRLSDELLFGR